MLTLASCDPLECTKNHSETKGLRLEIHRNAIHMALAPKSFVHFFFAATELSLHLSSPCHHRPATFPLDLHLPLIRE